MCLCVCVFWRLILFVLTYNIHFETLLKEIFPRRYNLFIVFYPLGVVGELMTIYSALPFVRRTGMYSIRLPNLYNMSFDYYYCLIIIMLSYIPCKIHFTGKCIKGQSDKHVFFFFVSSVSSALLPHAAAEKKGAPWGGHSGEGRLNRPPPPRRLSGNTLTVPVLQELETEAGDRELFILLTSLTAPFHIRKTTLHLS